MHRTRTVSIFPTPSCCSGAISRDRAPIEPYWGRARAVADYTEVIRLEPKNADSYRLRGIAYLYSGDLATNGYFTPRLQRLYPGTLFYDIFPGQFRSFAEVWSAERVKKLVEARPCAVVLGSSNIRQTRQTFLAGAKTESERRCATIPRR